MAIDNAEKRKSASQVSPNLFGPGVTPNASKDVEWRQQAGHGYSGIAPDGVGTFQAAWAIHANKLIGGM